MRLLHKWSQANQKNNSRPENDKPSQEKLTESYTANIRMIQAVYKQCSDVVFRPFQISGHINATIIYISGLTDHEGIGQYVLIPLMQGSTALDEGIGNLVEKSLPVSEVKPVNTIQDCVNHLSIGHAVLIIDGHRQGIAIAITKTEKRSVEEPQAESVIRGPREGFTETLTVNLSLVRRKIRTPLLKTESMTIGRYTGTEVVLTYIEGLVLDELLKEVRTRVKSIDIDGILETSYIEEMIEDKSLTPFPRSLVTERPDVVAANLLEGRIAIFVNGTPFVLIVPISFFSLLQSPEDYYDRYIFSTATRWLRYVFLAMSMLLPSLYVAILSYHQEMLPASLYFSIASSRETVPFPAIVEALIMEIAFEALREAGVRLPKQVGSAVSIVGALVIGQAAVAAGIVSAPMVMVVAITGISSFMVPHYAIGFTLRIIRFPIMLLAGMLGLLGVIMGILAVLIHVCTLRSFGVPYMSPLATVEQKDLKDILIRAPWWKMNTRPSLTIDRNIHRQPAARRDKRIQDEQ
ncbi:spore germination protein [Paenibacillus oenotherae]|uniref:Spore germination protein n=2 Tax=Paenibacillus oenotherae TaxID=1435645 RepID=A0ABS7DAZ0_9BACL|nr:spore germination protein [Paenibacillus oenotherae]